MYSRIVFACAVLFATSVCPALAENRASKMFTAAMAKKVLNTEISPTPGSVAIDIANGKTWVSRVVYSAKDGGNEAPSASLIVRHAESPAEAKKIFDSTKNAYHADALEGFGDAAFRTIKPAKLNVLQGSNWFTITCGTRAKPDLTGQEKAARAILASKGDKAANADKSSNGDKGSKVDKPSKGTKASNAK